MIAKEAELGCSYMDWNMDQRIWIVNELVKYEPLTVPSDRLAVMNDPTATNEERISIATGAMVYRYGREDAISAMGVMEKELGKIEDWGIENQAWYTAALIKYGTIGQDQERFMLPADTDASLEQVQAFARMILTTVFGLTDDEAAALKNHTYFRQEALYGRDPVWLMYYYSEPFVGGGYIILLRRDGKALGVARSGVSLTIPYDGGSGEEWLYVK